MGDESDAILVLDMTDEVRLGEDVTVRLRSSGTGSADIRVQFSNDNVSYGSAIDLNFDKQWNVHRLCIYGKRLTRSEVHKADRNP